MKNNNRAPLPGHLAGLEPLSRRGFLRASVLAGAALTSGCASLFGRKDAPETLQYYSLKPDEVDVITRLTEIMLPTERYGLPSSTTVVPTVKNIDIMAQRFPEQTRELLGLGIWVFNNRPMMSFKFKKFTSLSDAKALEYVNAMQEGAFFERGLMTTLKALIALNYWRDERTWPGLEYHGPVTETWGVRRLGNAPLPRA
ncbi:transcriptional initiation protein Tat [Alcanivorax sediminis]|uniref:Transcriptional initiation protein Tat n=1 Tax=Alcanivorax sediminis TaxID=2663008 RepID=A0A6N7LUL8_9GAMM|nr:transcriptional initiation protein Tat [Alcanivorax sediminis]MQX54137.1 transcriptional initiation protein Tat [Alcanivorax sediminis]